MIYTTSWFLTARLTRVADRPHLHRKRGREGEAGELTGEDRASRGDRLSDGDERAERADAADQGKSRVIRRRIDSASSRASTARK